MTSPLLSQTVISNSMDGAANSISSQIQSLGSLPSSRGGMVRGKAQWRRGGGRPREKATPDKIKPSPRPRPTHFLALPLYNHEDLRTRVSAFQTALLGEQAPKKAPTRVSTIVEGLDTSIVIDPMTLHMTLGVLALEPEETSTSAGEGAGQSPSVPDSSSTSPLDSHEPPETITEPPDQISDSALRPRKTVASALNLLSSLKETISGILSGSDGVQVPLEVLDVLKTERMRIPGTQPGAAAGSSRVGDPNVAVADSNNEHEGSVGASVLFLGPDKGHSQSEERRKLERVCDLVYQTFKKEGYLTDTRPLKLHCTILNASHRKPNRRIPFSYSDILASSACQMLGADPATPLIPKIKQSETRNTPIDSDAPEPNLTKVLLVGPTTSSATGKPKYRPPLKIPPPLPIALGTYRIREVQLWEMGSHGPNNQYVSSGGIVLK